MALYLVIFTSFCSFFSFTMTEEPELTIPTIMNYIESNQLPALKVYLNNFEETKLSNFINNSFILHEALLTPEVSDEIIEVLLENFADPNNPLKDDWGSLTPNKKIIFAGATPVHCAVAMNRSTYLLKILKRYGGDFFCKDSLDQTPFSMMFIEGVYMHSKFYKKIKQKQQFTMAKFLKKYAVDIAIGLPTAAIICLMGYFYLDGYCLVPLESFGFSY